MVGRVETRNIMGNFGFNQMNAREIEDVLKKYDNQSNVDYKNQYTYQNIIEILTK